MPLVFLLTLSFVALGAMVGVSLLLHHFDRVSRGESADFAAYLAVFLSEWWYNIALFLLYPFGWLPKRAPVYVAGAGPPIVLMPGVIANSSCMFVIYWRLKRLGYENIYTVDPPLMGNIHAATRAIASRLRAIADACGGQELLGIAHSRGGLVMRHCLRDIDDISWRGMITLGTPHGGTRLAAMVTTSGTSELIPGSAFLASLDAVTKSHAVEIHAIYTTMDAMILPSHHAAYSGGGDVFYSVGHNGLLFSAEVFTRIAAYLPVTQV